ncbi:uncharacterized protein LOC112451995, partial [Temnothorax curvispinosus]|uniref:Uncharacterized protein LOC112451995 n=1 Tax=Temnothorax curvispinosus TaxID=300111 RepID=A0A6J1PDZ0_9HYME
MSKRGPYKRYLEPGSTRDIPRSTVKRRKKVDLSDLDALQTNNSQNNQQISTFDHDLCTLEESSNNEINEPSSLRVYEESVFQDADNDNNNEVIEENVDDTIYFETNLDEVVDDTSDSEITNLSDTDIDDERENSNQSEENVGHEYPFLEEQLSASSTTSKGDVLLMTLAIGLRHSLPWIAITDILKMINVIF